MSNNLPIPALTGNDTSKIWTGISIGQLTECWEWTKGCVDSGYGAIDIQNKKYRVTRLIYFLAYSVDPGPLFVLHTCDNPPCCNPRHLWLGDSRDNGIDMETKDRGNHACGESNGCAKLSENDILTIRNSTDTDTVLGKQFAVSSVNIGRIRRGKMWKHVGGPIINRSRGRPVGSHS